MDAQAGPSFYPSSQPANTGERARTLKKIDEIEAQMSTAWFKHKSGQAATRAAAAEEATRYEGPRSSAPSVVPDEQADDAVGSPQQGQAFAPTVFSHELEEAPALNSLEPRGVVAAAVPAAHGERIDTAETSRSGVVLFGGHTDFNVEVVVEAKQDPAIEEVAIRFANGDVVGAEAGLLELLGVEGSRQDDIDTWLTLFDLYRASNQQDKFDDAGIDFADQFGRSAPQWALISETSESLAPVAVQEAPVVSGLFHWTGPSTIGTQSIAALNASLQRNAAPWRIDWRHVKTIEPAALPGFTAVLQNWGNTASALKFLGDDRLLAVLTEQSPTDDRSVDPQWWEARLALLRLQGEMDEFELVALNYCVTYEVSPPSWETPLGSFNRMTEEGQTVIPSDFAPAAIADSQLGAPPPLPPGAPRLDDQGVLRADLSGELVGSAEAAVARFAGNQGALRVELNCRKLLRVDFGAAGDLLNWAMQQKGEGRPVTFKQVNRLVAAFFGVIGIQDTARVLLRAD